MMCASLAVLLCAPIAVGAQGAIAPVPVDADAWFQAPCLPDSSDDWGWTRYDLRGMRIRVPPDVRHIKVPNLDELHFRFRRASLRLRVNRNASSLFREYATPLRMQRHCSDDIGGLLAEAVSFRNGAVYGFAALWPDADRGEWLAAVIQGLSLPEVTYLRRSLFTIAFPDERRR